MEFFHENIEHELLFYRKCRYDYYRKESSGLMAYERRSSSMSMNVTNYRYLLEATFGKSKETSFSTNKNSSKSNEEQMRTAGIDTNSGQYTTVEKNDMAEILRAEQEMSPDERLAYEMMGTRALIVKNRMKQYDSNGNRLNAYGVAGMDMTGKNILDEHKVINISEEYRQMMFDSTKREYIRDDGAAKGPTKRTEIYTAYQKSEKLENRLKGSWTLQQYENLYRREFYNAVKRANPNWKIGEPFDPGILDSVTRESAEANTGVVQGEYGEKLVKKSLDVKA